VYLRDQLELELARKVLLLEDGVLADVGGDHALDLVTRHDTHNTTTQHNTHATRSQMSSDTARVGGGWYLARLEEEAEAEVVDAAVVGDDGEVLDAGGAQRADQLLGNAAQTEAADQPISRIINK
jgi:hypothetical protein